MNENSQELVSVITITRNRGNIIRRAIQSVLDQTYKRLEYIIVDGASEDNTEEVVKYFQNIDDRIIYIKQDTNISVVLSIDYAFKISKGNYISFLDDDDEYLPEKIEKQVILLKSLPDEYGFVYCWMNCYDHNSGKLIRSYQQTLNGDILFHLLKSPIIGGTPVFLLRRKTFENIGGWNKTIKHISDWEMITRVAREYKADVVPETLVLVFENHGKLRMSNTNFMQKEYLIRNIELHKHFLDEFKDSFKHSKHLQTSHLKPLIMYYLALGKLGDAVFTIIELNKIPDTKLTILKSIARGVVLRLKILIS
ncbi:MAG: glycosyltransferase [Bacteroidales bacterium]|jgi:glycosyltransferase involved in cell wall biosynthesis|nr:glycosyltransferase [Bacteroidales bacterium]